MFMNNTEKLVFVYPVFNDEKCHIVTQVEVCIYEDGKNKKILDEKTFGLNEVEDLIKYKNSLINQGFHIL